MSPLRLLQLPVLPVVAFAVAGCAHVADRPKTKDLDAPEVSVALAFLPDQPDAYEVGRPLPLVCSRAYPANGGLKGRPNLQLMWENYIHYRPGGVWGEVGGLVAVNGRLAPEHGGWANACTVRLSHMLNRAGHVLPTIKGQTVTGAQGDNYFFRLLDAEAYLTKTFGKPDMEWRDGTGWEAELPNHPGLALMLYYGSDATGHATVWNGAGTVDGTGVGGRDVLFWTLPCFVPDRRKPIG